MTPVVEAVYTYYTVNGLPANSDWIQSIEHRKFVSGSPVTLEKVTYVRGLIGEPTQVSWYDGTSVTVGYDPAQALRVVSENFSASAGVEKTYTYHDSGNRGSLNGSTWTYDSGYQLSAQGGKNYAYDGNGNLSSITASPNVSFGYTVDDRLNTYAKTGSPTMTYWYDAFGRRTKATDGTTNRRFVWGPVPGTDLDVVHMITDDNDAVKSVYVYAGAQPIARFGINSSTGDIDMTTLRFYLEDAVGSVLGLADQTGALTARFRYDGFGNAWTQPAGTGISDPALSSHIPAGSGGDFRFQGTWLETASGLYHMRARDYDPETGRFIERDPIDPDQHDPASYNPYIFAASNPYYYADPTGLDFTIAELNVSTAIESGLQGLRGVAVQKAKSYIVSKVEDALVKLAVDPLANLLPVNLGAMFQGIHFENAVRKAVCGALGDPADYFYFDVGINRNGTPTGVGMTCNDANRDQYKIDQKITRAGIPTRGSAFADVILSSQPPRIGQSNPKSWVLAEVKRSTQTAYNDYISGRKASQFDNFASYASKHTYSRAMAIIIATRTPGNQYKTVEAILMRKALARGAIAVVDVIGDFGAKP